MSLKIISAEEAASFVKNGDRVGFSGFTGEDGAGGTSFGGRKILIGFREG